jgi:hypothetical protein
MTTEEQLAIKLELIRDSIVGFKFATDALEIRANKMESDLAECRSRISDLSNTGIRVGEQLSVINKSMDVMSTDIRSVRNSVLSAIIGATFIWLVGTAVSTFHLANNSIPSVNSVNRK